MRNVVLLIMLCLLISCRTVKTHSRSELKLDSLYSSVSIENLTKLKDVGFKFEIIEYDSPMLDTVTGEIRQPIKSVTKGEYKAQVKEEALKVDSTSASVRKIEFTEKKKENVFRKKLWIILGISIFITGIFFKLYTKTKRD